MKILIKGDFHNRFSEFKQQLEQRKDVDFVLGVGDSGIYWKDSDVYTKDRTGYKNMLNEGHTIEYMDDIKDWPIPTYVVPGNHEDMTYIDNLIAAGLTEVIPNFNVMHSSVLVKECGDGSFLYIFFLGKILVEKSLDLDRSITPIKGIQKWIKQKNHIARSEIKHLLKIISNINKKRRPVDKVIWISHEAPAHIHLEDHYPAGHNFINQLLDLVAPDFAFFGHYHYAYKLDDVSQIVPKNELLEIEI